VPGRLRLRQAWPFLLAARLEVPRGDHPCRLV
jgi:hypothetical protein